MCFFGRIIRFYVCAFFAGQETQLVSQTYCSAISCAYGSLPLNLWEPMATLVLDAAYEATLWAAVLNKQRTGSSKVYLTSVGGGVFGNKPEWISNSIARAIAQVSQRIDFELQVYLVHFRRLDMTMVGDTNRTVAFMAPKTATAPQIPSVQPSINSRGSDNEMRNALAEPLLGELTALGICLPFGSKIKSILRHSLLRVEQPRMFVFRTVPKGRERPCRDSAGGRHPARRVLAEPDFVFDHQRGCSRNGRWIIQLPLCIWRHFSE